jgi:hypothetical protein
MSTKEEGKRGHNEKVAVYKPKLNPTGS